MKLNFNLIAATGFIISDCTCQVLYNITVFTVVLCARSKRLHCLNVSKSRPIVRGRPLLADKKFKNFLYHMPPKPIEEKSIHRRQRRIFIYARIMETRRDHYYIL